MEEPKENSSSVGSGVAKHSVLKVDEVSNLMNKLIVTAGCKMSPRSKVYLNYLGQTVAE